MSIFNEAMSFVFRKGEDKALVPNSEERKFDTRKAEILAQLAQIEWRRKQAIESGDLQSKIRGVLAAIKVDETHLQDELEAIERSQRILQKDRE